MKKEKKKPAARIRKSVQELIPLVDFDADKEFFYTGDGCMDLIQITSKDLINSSADEVEYDCLKFAKLYKTYESDLKIIALNFPCSTERQQEFLNYKMQHTANAVYQSYLQRCIDELAWIGKNDTTREYYFMIFAKTPEELEKNILTIQSILGFGRSGLLQKISLEKKQQIFFKLANKSSVIFE